MFVKVEILYLRYFMRSTLVEYIKILYVKNLNFVKFLFTECGTKLLMNAGHSERSDIENRDFAKDERKTMFEGAEVLS